jgi:hypothetical protein
MMYPYNLEQVAADRQKQIREEVERERLLRSIPRCPSFTQKLLRRGRAFAGMKMVEWGTKLQGCQPVVSRPRTISLTPSGDSATIP